MTSQPSAADEAALLDRMRSYDELLRQLDSEPLFAITNRGRHAEPRYLNSKSGHGPSPREEVEEKKRQVASTDMANRPPSASRCGSRASSRTRTPSKFADVQPKYLEGYERTVSRIEASPRRLLEEEKRRKEEAMIALQQQSSPQSLDRSLSASKKRNTTPSRYMNAFAQQQGVVTPRQEIEARKSEARKAMVALTPPMPQSNSPLNASVASSGSSSFLTSADIAELRGINLISPELHLLCQAVCLLLGISPALKPDPNSQQGLKIHDYYMPLRAHMLKGHAFMESLLSFDSNQVTLETFKKLRRLVRQPEFTPELYTVKGPRAAPILCRWVLETAHAAANNLNQDAQVLHEKYATHVPVSPPRKIVELAPRTPIASFSPAATSNTAPNSGYVSIDYVMLLM
jgi:hypothetical protein